MFTYLLKFNFVLLVLELILRKYINQVSPWTNTIPFCVFLFYVEDQS